ncbi:hypothetical protein CBER1_07665 [Cercospora berteroae]|uniref:Uncharacterized protein n=1 Tax=Cercospora berteroae TaxID=357750 RepID=A0A2S6C4M6_9PEZI|nr:hypothetical protein CBER1_07665 [Cercospora berteroae]
MSRVAGRVCGTFRYKLLGQTVHFTSDPENIKAMLTAQFSDFDLGHVRRAIVGEVLGDGIFVQDDSRPRNRGAARTESVQSTCGAGGRRWTAPVNIQEMFVRLTMDTASEVLCGESVNSQLAATTDQYSEASSFGANFDQAQFHVAKKFRLVEWHWLHNPPEYQANIRVINAFAKRYVDMALAKGSACESKTPEKEKYIFLRALAKQPSDPVELRAQTLNILLAGRDTTASLTTLLGVPRNAPQTASLRETSLRRPRHLRHLRESKRDQLLETQGLPIPAVYSQ